MQEFANFPEVYSQQTACSWNNVTSELRKEPWNGPDRNTAARYRHLGMLCTLLA